MREHCAMTSTVALGILLLEAVHTALGCLSTPPEQRASEGSDVSLTCDFSKCPGPLDHRMLSVEWEFQGSASSDESKPIIYHIQNNTVATVPGVVFKGDVALGDFSISLRSVTMKDNGTYTCRLRAALENNIYKNHTYLVITPGMVKHEGDSCLCIVPLCAVIGLVCASVVFLGKMVWRTSQRSLRQQLLSRWNVEEAAVRHDTQHKQDIATPVSHHHHYKEV
ncbi:hypothetical protein AOLI_G00322980 [Acnodon oligacanthus]